MNEKNNVKHPLHLRLLALMLALSMLMTSSGFQALAEEPESQISAEEQARAQSEAEAEAARLAKESEEAARRQSEAEAEAARLAKESEEAARAQSEAEAEAARLAKESEEQAKRQSESEAEAARLAKESEEAARAQSEAEAEAARLAQESEEQAKNENSSEQQSQADQSESISDTQPSSGSTEAAPETESGKESETAAEAETAEAKLKSQVKQEVFEEADGTLAVKYTVEVTNKTPEADAKDVTVKAVLGKQLTCYGKEGETKDISRIEDIRQIPSGLDLEELKDYTPEQLEAYGGAAVWKDQTIPGEAKKEYVFFARVDEEAQSKEELPALFFVAGKGISQEKIQWLNAELLDRADTQETELPGETELMEETELPEETADILTVTLTATAGNVTVTAEAAEGVLPEGVTMTAEEVENAAIDETLTADVEAKGLEVVAIRIFDITFFNAEGEEIQPEGDVEITYTGLEIPEEAEEALVYHMEEEVNAPKLLSDSELSGEAAGEIRFGADHFSPKPVVFARRSSTGDESDVTITPALEGIIFAGTEYDLLDKVTVEPIAVTVDGQEYEVKVKVSNITCEKPSADGTDYVSDESYVWDGTTTLTPVASYRYTITYQAYIEMLGDEGTTEEEIRGEVSITLEAKAAGDIGTVLPEDQDEAYISKSELVKMTTGTAPWDTAEGAGNDTTGDDAVIRTYDTISYTTGITTKMYANASHPGYRYGRIYFEYILPYTKEQAQFEVSSMGWLSTKESCYYELIETDGKQVLRGSFMMEPTEGNSTSIGNSYHELPVVIRILQMKNGETVQPSFTYWLEGNQTGAQYKVIDGATSYEGQQVKIPTGGLVTGNDTVCGDHSRAEVVTIEAEPATVSAAPRYNIQVKNGSASANQYLGTLDFSTGNEKALNKDEGSVYGRLGAYGITIMMEGKSKSEGLRGVELPDENTAIEFDVDLSSIYKVGKDTTYDNGTIRKPLLWSLQGNRSVRTKEDGRAIPSALASSYVHGGAPLNAGSSKENCSNGGTWSYSLNADGSVHVTVTGFQINTEHFPYCDTGAGTDRVYTYYNPTTQTNYWEIQKACFSAGEMWVVQPYKDQDDDKTYAQKYNAGTFTVTMEAKNLTMQSRAGQQVAPEAAYQETTLSDNKVLQSMALEKPGNIDNYILYLKNPSSDYLDALTSGCAEDGKDWAVLGTPLQIEEYISNDQAEGLSVGVAYDALIKFDDAFFAPSGSAWTAKAGYSKGTVKVLWGAKADSSGWNHQGLKPDQAGYDAEMMSATADDLIFFTSLDALKSAGYTPVAALAEWRGVANVGSMNHLHFYIGGNVKTSCTPNYVYMTTHCAAAWNKGSIQDAVAKYCGKSASELIDDDYDKYVKSSEFPSRAGTTRLSYAESYPGSPWWLADSAHEPDGIGAYQKAYYEEHKYAGGSAGMYWGDSCLVMGHKAEIAASVEQTYQGAAKTTYEVTSGQRYVDYVLHPSLQINSGEPDTSGETITTDVTIEVDLPQDLSLTYLENSLYLGGTYSENKNRPGTVVKGIPLQTDTSGNYVVTPTYAEVDGKERVVGFTILMRNVEFNTAQQSMTLPDIHFSCEIGVSGDPEKDVEDGQSIQITAVISTTEDQRAQTSANNNRADVGITITRGVDLSLTKLADQIVAERDEDMGFTMSVGNNSETIIEDCYITENLPYNRDANGSYFNGESIITEFSFGAADNSVAAALKDNFKLYYTTNEEYKDKTSAWFMNEEGTSGFEGAFDIENSSDWTEISFSEGADGNSRSMQYVASNLPSEESQKTAPIVSIIAYGDLPGKSTMKLHVTLKLPRGNAGDQVVNQISRGDLEARANSYIVKRQLRGQTWLDENENGAQNSGEAKLSNIKVTLVKLKEGGSAGNLSDYEVYSYTDLNGNNQKASMQTGQQMNLSTGAVTAYLEGQYLFTDLPAGTFGVVFSDDKWIQYSNVSGENLTIYKVSPMDATYDSIDSDAAAVYAEKADGGYALGDLTCAYILNIDMPEKSRLSTGTYTSANHDAGFYLRKGSDELKGEKTVEGTSELLSFDFGIYTEKECTTPASAANVNQSASSSAKDGSFAFTFKYTIEDLKKEENGTTSYEASKIFDYYVKEDSEKAGYTRDSMIYHVQVTVSKSAEGGLSVVPKIVGTIADGKETSVKESDNTNTLAFTNVYYAEGTADLTGSKTVEGGPMRDDFTFTLYQAVEEDGKLVKGDPVEAGWTAGSPADGDNSAVPENKAPDVEANPVTAAIASGSDPNEAGCQGGFTFRLHYNMDDLRVENNGTVIYQKETTKTYLVEEDDTDAAGYTKDPAVYIVTVTIEDQGDGNLTVTPVVTSKKTGETVTENPADGLSFVNTFAAVGNAFFGASKTVEGGQMKNFNFYLYSDEDCTQKMTVRPFINDADGKITFTVPTKAGKDYAFDMSDMLETSDGDGENGDAADGNVRYATKTIDGKTVVAKDFVYYIKEETLAQTNGLGYESDDSVYRVTVTMQLTEMDDAAVLSPTAVKFEKQSVGDGGYSYGTESAAAEFTNEYAAEGTWNLTVDKILTGTGRLPVDGNGQGFTFKLEELSDPADPGTADSDKFQATAAVTSLTEDTASDTPRYTGSVSFADADMPVYTMADLEKKEDGKVTGYEEKIFKYLLTEVKPDNADEHYTYDDTVYEIWVTVNDEKQNGTLSVTKEIKKRVPNETTDNPDDYTLEDVGTKENPKNPEFNNSYTAEGSMTFQVEKTLTGQPLAEALEHNGQFTFVLSTGTAEYEKIGENGETVQAAAISDPAVEAMTEEERTKAVTADSDGKVSYTLAYDQDDVGKTFYYEIKENGDANKTYYEYDATTYKFAVTISDNNGTLETEVRDLTVYAEDRTAQEKASGLTKADNTVAVPFINHYLAEGGFTLNGQKNVMYRTAQATEGEFTFDVYELAADGTLTLLEGASAATEEGGSFTLFAEDFYEITDETTAEQKQAMLDAHTYIIREHVPEVTGTMNYSTEAYKVTVTVSDDHAGKLEVTEPEIEVTENYTTPEDSQWAAAENIVFTNTQQAYGTASLNAGKVLKGNRATEIGDKEFTFQAVCVSAEKDRNGNNGIIDGYYDAEQKEVIFATLAYDEDDVGRTYVYRLTENAGTDANIDYSTEEFYAAVTVTDSGELDTETGKEILNTEVKYYEDWDCVNELSEGVTFTNQYKATGEIVLTVKKTLEGRTSAGIQANEFIFGIYEVTTDEDGETVKTLLEENGNPLYGLNDAEGTVTFPAIHYTQEDIGTHKYELVEFNGKDESITYDDQVFEVMVTVSDIDGTGKLSAKQNGITEETVFENQYHATGSVKLTGIKKLLGNRAQAVQAGEFSFTVTDAAGEEVATGVTLEDGIIDFTEIPYDQTQVGEHTYTITENAGEDTSIEYTAAPVEVKVTVTDIGQGALEAVATYPEGGAIFENQYRASGKAVFEGTKKLLGDRKLPLMDDEFTFQVTENSQVVASGKSKADGSIVFDEISYTEADQGIHTYLIREVTGTDRNILYSSQVFQAQVTVTDAGEGKLDVKTVYPQGSIVFENQFTENVHSCIQVTKRLTHGGAAINTKDHTFYVALFSDEELQQRVSDVKALSFRNNSSSTAVFEDVATDKIYYVAETDAAGNSFTSGILPSGELFAAEFPDGNRIDMSKTNGTAELSFENTFPTVPEGFYREGELTLTKRLLGANGKEMTSDETFYAGIFADKNHTVLSDMVSANIVALNLSGGSTASETIKVSYDENGSRTLYVTEVDENGTPVEEADDFVYEVSVDQASVTISDKNLTDSVTITNQEKSEDESEDKPESNESGKSDAKAGKPVKTGDDTPIGLYVLLLAAAAAAMAVLGFRRRRRNAEEK